MPPYSEQTRPGKTLTTGDSIAPGSISVRHLAPDLFSEIQKIKLHNHSGVNSVQIKLQDLTGSFTPSGILIRSPNGALWRIQVSNAGTITATAV